MQQDKPLWSPTLEAVRAAPMTDFRLRASEAAGRDLPDYDALHRWSVEDREAFWALLWDYCGVIGEKDLILIDTPGFGPKDMDAAEDLARFLAGRPEIDTHLVLTASARSADLKRVVDRFEVFRPRKLLFTKLDETGTFGPILNEAVRTGKPVSFLAAGQQIPDDLEPATADRILELALKREQAQTPAAAA